MSNVGNNLDKSINAVYDDLEQLELIAQVILNGNNEKNLTELKKVNKRLERIAKQLEKLEGSNK